MAQQDNESQSADNLLITAVVFESVLGLVAILLGWLIGPDARALIPEFDPENLWPIGIGVGYGLIAAIPILVFIAGVRRIPWEPIRNLEKLSNDGIVSSLLQLRPAELIVISLCAGVGEELLFRGWMMQWMIGTTDPTNIVNIGIGLVGSSIAFGMVHPISKLYIFLAAIMGVYFGVLLIYTENLLVPIVAHAAYDAVQMIWGSRDDGSES